MVFSNALLISFLPLIFLWSLLPVDWHILYYFIGLIGCFQFFSFVFMYALLIDFHYSLSQILICSSVLFSSYLLTLAQFLSWLLNCLIFIDFSLYFLGFVCLFLWWPAFLSIAVFSSFHIFIPSFWTWGLVDWRGLFHCLCFQGISLILLIGSGSPAFSFYFYISDSVNLGETVIYCGLKGLRCLLGTAAGINLLKSCTCWESAQISALPPRVGSLPSLTCCQSL